MLFCLVGMLPTSLAAQNNNESQSPPAGEESEHGYGHRRWDPAQRAEMICKQLKLTSDQQSKLLDILKSEQSQMEKLRSDSSLSQDDRRSKMMDIHNSDQQKKWDKMQSERGQWQGHRHDHQHSGASPDAS
jgi:hypothetical protein